MNSIYKRDEGEVLALALDQYMKDWGDDLEDHEIDLVEDFIASLREDSKIIIEG